MRINEQNIIEKAINVFLNVTGLQMTVYHRHDKADTDLILKEKDYDLKFTVEVKAFVNKGIIGMLKNQFNKQDNIPLFITTYINPAIAESMRDLDINFIDTAGNIFIKVSPLHIDIRGRKLNDAEKNNAAGRAFQTAGLQIIFALLCNPGMENNTYREIAEAANTATGTVHITLRDLEKQNYLVNTGKKKKIVNKDKLLQKWITFFPDKLKPKYFAGRYNADNDFLWRDIDIKKFDALWGGETGAAKLTGYLTPFIHTVYIGEKIGEFILRNRLRKNEGGNILIQKKFWTFDDEGDTVNPILVYADLMATADARNIETANILYEKEIVKYIR